MKVRGGELRYPRPDNWVVVPKQKYAAGDLIGTAYHTTSPVYKLNAVISLMKAKGKTIALIKLKGLLGTSINSNQQYISKIYLTTMYLLMKDIVLAVMFIIAELLE